MGVKLVGTVLQVAKISFYIYSKIPAPLEELIGNFPLERKKSKVRFILLARIQKK
jgi:hypothetical protein